MRSSFFLIAANNLHRGDLTIIMIFSFSNKESNLVRFMLGTSINEYRHYKATISKKQYYENENDDIDNSLPGCTLNNIQ
jgi:hypothetical protein